MGSAGGTVTATQPLEDRDTAVAQPVGEDRFKTAANKTTLANQHIHGPKLKDM